MAKKDDKLTFKGMLNQFMQKSLQSLISVVAEQSDHIIAWIKDISSLKRKLRRLFVSLILVVTGLTVLLMGFGYYLAAMFPNMKNGVAHVLVGVVVVVIAMLYSKYGE